MGNSQQQPMSRDDNDLIVARRQPSLLVAAPHPMEELNLDLSKNVYGHMLFSVEGLKDDKKQECSAAKQLGSQQSRQVDMRRELKIKVS